MRSHSDADLLLNSYSYLFKNLTNLTMDKNRRMTWRAASSQASAKFSIGASGSWPQRRWREPPAQEAFFSVHSAGRVLIALDCPSLLSVMDCP